MKKAILAAAIAAFTFGNGAAFAKEWTSNVIVVKDGKAVTMETVKSCNYASAVSQARKAAEKYEGAFFNLASADNEVDCPKRTRKAKGDDTVKAN
jgi:hypothetical protein